MVGGSFGDRIGRPWRHDGRRWCDGTGLGAGGLRRWRQAERGIETTPIAPGLGCRRSSRRLPWRRCPWRRHRTCRGRRRRGRLGLGRRRGTEGIGERRPGIVMVGHRGVSCVVGWECSSRRAARGYTATTPAPWVGRRARKRGRGRSREVSAPTAATPHPAQVRIAETGRVDGGGPAVWRVGGPARPISEPVRGTGSCSRCRPLRRGADRGWRGRAEPGRPDTRRRSWTNSRPAPNTAGGCRR